jgi:hypothetical protein
MPSRMSLGRRVSGFRCSHDSATPDAFTFTMRYPVEEALRANAPTPDAFTFTMRYPVEEALRANARGGIAEIANGI